MNKDNGIWSVAMKSDLGQRGGDIMERVRSKIGFVLWVDKGLLRILRGFSILKFKVPICLKKMTPKKPLVL